MKISSFFALSLVLFTLLVSCDKSENDCGVSARFEDLTGLDGCGFVLQIGSGNNQQTLEVRNLGDFDIAPADGMNVCIQYEVAADGASICMVGQVVNLTSIVEQ